MDRAELLRRLDPLLDFRDITDRRASLESGLGDQLIRNYRNYPNGPVDVAQMQPLSAVLGVPVTFLTDPAAFDPMGEDTNREWMAWALRATAEYFAGRPHTPDQFQDMTCRFYRAIAGKARDGEMIDERIVRDLALAVRRGARARERELIEATRPRKPRSRRPKK